MKSLILTFILLFFAMTVPQKIEASEKNLAIETESKQSRVMLNLSSQVNHIEIENEFLTIQSNIEIYYLEAAAISIDMLLLKAEDDRINFLSYNFKDQTLYYTLKVDGAIYYSSTPLGYENVDLDIFNQNIIQYFIEENSINYYDHIDLYNIFLESIYSNYQYHFSIKESNPVSYSSEYTFTGTADAVNFGKELDSLIDINLITTVGIHTGNIYDTSGIIRYIYVIDTKNYGGSMPFTCLITMWKIDFFVLNNIVNENKKLIKFDISNHKNIYINGNYTTANIVLAEEGYSYVPIDVMESNIEVSGYSFINEYSINYTKNSASTPEYINSIDGILGFIVPYYEPAKEVIGFIGNLFSYKNKVKFNDSIKNFEFTNLEDDYNLKSVGFKSDGPYNHRYNFKQTCQVGGLPDFNTDFKFKLRFYIIEGPEINFLHSIQMVKSICSHGLTTTKVGNNLAVHKVKCSVCNVYYYKEHNYVDTGDHASICQCGDTLVTGHTFNSFKFIDPSVHKATCKCGYSKNESHQKYYSGGKCWACDYKGPIFLPDQFKLKSRDESIECPLNI